MLKNFVALDLETSGVNPSKDKIIEIGMAKIKDGKIIDSYNKLVNPQISLDPKITKITGITDLELIGQASIDDIIYEVVDFIGDNILLGHNILFDYSFLKQAAAAKKLSIPNMAIDSLKIARKLLPNLPSRRLVDLCNYYNIDPGKSHRAYYDAVSAFRLYEHLALLAADDEIINKPMQLEYKVKKNSPITAAQKNYLSALVLKHNLKLSKDINEYSKSEASKAIDNIISNYGR